jgi:hypothetical protein
MRARPRISSARLDVVIRDRSRLARSRPLEIATSVQPLVREYRSSPRA